MRAAEVREALSKGFGFTLQNGEVVKDSLFERAKKLSRAYTTEKAREVALKLIGALHDQERLSPNAAKKDDLYKAARYFRKNVAPLCNRDSAFSTLAKEEVAFGLGIDKEALEKNKGLYEFARETAFNVYLARFHDHLTLDANSRVSFRVDPDKAIKLGLSSRTIRARWDEVRDKVEKELLPTARKEKFTTFFYSDQGFTFDTFTRPVDTNKLLALRPYRHKSRHKWGKRYVYQVCVHADALGPDIKRMHTWRRLKEPNGTIYSIGDYRPSDTKAHLTCAPLVVKQQNPDSSEFTPDYFSEKLNIEITKEQFKLLRAVEESRLNGTFHNKSFRNLNDNCTNKSLSNLEMIGIKVPDFTVSFWQAVFPHWFMRGMLKVHATLPSSIAKITAYAGAVFGNFILPVFNGLKTNPALPEEKAQISTFSDLFDPHKMDHTSPYSLVHGPLKELKAWREQIKQDAAFLKAKGWTKEDVDYRVPDSWRIGVGK